jgi:hypothetical protein
MIAPEVLNQARAAGVELSATPEGKLRWRRPGGLPSELRQALMAHKAEILELLGLPNGALPFNLDDVYEAFAERVGIMEYEGKLPHAEAERLALAEVLKRLRATGGQWH